MFFRRRARFLALSLALALATTAPSRAEDPPPSSTPAPAAPEIGAARKVRLEYVLGAGAEKCPSADALAHAIRSEMDHDPFLSTSLSVLRVTIEREGKLYRGSYEIIDETGKVLLTKRIDPEGQACAVAIDQVAFSVGVFLPKLLTAPVVSSPPPPSPSPPPPPALPPLPASPPLSPTQVVAVVHEAQPSEIHGGGALGAVFNAGLLPALGIGPSAEAHLQYEHLVVGIEGSALFTPDFALDEQHSARTIAPMGTLRACYAIGPLSRVVSAVEICPLAGVGGLLLQARSRDEHLFNPSPYFLFLGLRVPVVWRARTKAPEGDLRTYLEFVAAPLRSKLSFGGESTYTTVWGGSVPLGISVGVDFGLVSGRSREWVKPEPEHQSATRR